MKVLILLSTILLLGACATTPTMKSVAGTYERKIVGHTLRLVLLENGVYEYHFNGENIEDEYKWKISEEGELYETAPNGDVGVFSINEDRSITPIAAIKDGKREEAPKEE